MNKRRTLPDFSDEPAKHKKQKPEEEEVESEEQSASGSGEGKRFIFDAYLLD